MTEKKTICVMNISVSMKLAYFNHQSTVLHISILFVCLIFAICVMRFRKNCAISYIPDETAKSRDSDRYTLDFCLRIGN